MNYVYYQQLSENLNDFAEKRRLDGELRGMQQEIDNLIVQMKNSEEKARKAVADAGNDFDWSVLKRCRTRAATWRPVQLQVWRRRRFCSYTGS